MGKDEETEIAVECSVLDIRFSFDVGRSMLDVGRSFFNVTCERLQNNLALMDSLPQHVNAPVKDEFLYNRYNRPGVRLWKTLFRF